MEDTYYFFDKIKMFIFIAKKENFEKIKESNLNDVLFYYFFITAISILGLGMLLIIEGATPLFFGILILLYLFNDVYSVVVYYIFTKLLGGKGNFSDMIRVYVYAITPTKIYGWIPVIGVVGVISLVNIANGIMKVFALSGKRAAAVIIGSIFLLAVLIFIIVYHAVSTLLG